MYKIIDIHTHQCKTDSFICLQNMSNGDQLDKNTSNYYSLGLHPWKVTSIIAHDIDWLTKNIAENKRVIAIGEIGLDKLCSIDISLQINAFKTQLLVAQENTLPVIIHNVRATNEILHLQKQIAPSTSFIFHGYRGKYSKAEAILKAGNYLSFGSSLLQKDIATEDCLRKTPANRLFLETDDSPASIFTIYTKAAEIRNISLAELTKDICNNFTSLFNISLHE
jgi:Mg-dependent DNase